MLVAKFAGKAAAACCQSKRVLTMPTPRHCQKLPDTISRCSSLRTVWRYTRTKYRLFTAFRSPDKRLPCASALTFSKAISEQQTSRAPTVWISTTEATSPGIVWLPRGTCVLAKRVGCLSFSAKLTSQYQVWDHEVIFVFFRDGGWPICCSFYLSQCFTVSWMSLGMPLALLRPPLPHRQKKIPIFIKGCCVPPKKLFWGSAQYSNLQQTLFVPRHSALQLGSQVDRLSYNRNSSDELYWLKFDYFCWRRTIQTGWGQHNKESFGHFSLPENLRLIRSCPHARNFG